MPSITIKIGLYTKKEQWQHTDLDGVPPLIAQHIAEPTGIYLPLSYQTQQNAYRFQPLWDFDDKENPTHALNDSRQFVESLTRKGIPARDLIPFVSGRKGIHIASRILLPERDDWYPIFAHAAKRRWAPQFPTLDGGIYQNRALVRAPWSRHHASPFARKKPIPWNLFWDGSFDEITRWAEEWLNDMQWAEIESLIRETLPRDAETPFYWRPFCDDLVLDFRKHQLQSRAVLAAKPVRVRRRFTSDWAALLDEAGIQYRERKSQRAGKIFALDQCPYCDGKHKAYVTPTGTLRCFRTSCEANTGIAPEVWTKDFDIELEFVEEEKQTDDNRPDLSGDRLSSAEDANARLREALERIHHLEPGKALLVSATPGLGKTTIALEHVARFAGRVIVAADTKERAAELYEQYTGKACPRVLHCVRGQATRRDARLIVGRNETNCERFDQIQIIGQKGYAPGKVFCPRCPFFPKNAKKEGRATCGYYEQFSDNRSRVTFCTYEQALYLHDAGQLDAELIVLDEDPTRAFMKQIALQIPHLFFDVVLSAVRYCAQDKDEKALPFPVRRFAAFLRQALAIAAAEIDSTRAIYRSKNLKALLEISAEIQGIKLEKLLLEVASCLENVYDKRGRLAGKTTEELERIPPAYLLDLARAIQNELAHAEVEEDWNSPLSVHVFRGVATLNFYSRFTLSGATPLVILDAYGRADYYQALLHRDVETVKVNALIHAKVIKIQLATSKRAFAARHDALFRRLDEVMAHYRAQQVLVYTHAALEAVVQNRYEGPEGSGLRNVTTQHFWAGRGKDEFKDYDVVVIFGTAEPNPQELMDECRALYAADKDPITPEPRPDDHRHRKDGRLETLLQMRREEEMEQAAHRTRPVWAEGKPKTVIIMSHLDLPGLEADEVIDPRRIEQMNRFELLAQFITDCMDQMGFYCEALAELVGVISLRSVLLSECRQRLARTATLIENTIREPVQPCDGADSLYPKNRNAYTTDRNTLLSAMELEEEILSFDRGNGKWVSIKVWGDVARAEAFFRSLLCDQFAQAEPFDPETLKAVCQRHEIGLTVLFVAPTKADAYSPLFSDGQSGCCRRNRPNRFDRRCQTGERGQRSAGDEG